MRIIRALPLAFAALGLVACGSSSSKKTPDAHVSTPDAPGGTIDAPIATVDAMPFTTPNWNAAVCSQSMACTLTGDICLAGQGATSGFCGASCGPDTQTTTSPTSYDTNCAAAYKGTGGTPACLFYSGGGTAGDQPPFKWYCAVACGTANGMNLGTCPTGLTCKLFTGQTYGACQP